MKRYAAYTRREKLFLIMSVSAIALLSLILYLDLSKRVTSSARKVVGKMVFAENDVRRRHDDQIVWEGIGANEVLLNRDSVSTAGNSEARVRLRDGTVIELGENSLVMFADSDDELLIDLTRGYVQVQRDAKGASPGGKVRIVSERKEITVGRGTVTVTKEEKKEPEVYVKTGEAEVSSGNREQTVKKGEIAVLKDEGIAVRKETLKLLSPEENARLYTDGERAAVAFAWSPGEQAVGMYDLEISADLGFTAPVRLEKTAKTGAAASLPAGAYYWRITGRTGEGKIVSRSVVRKLSVIRDEPLRLLAPENATAIEFFRESPLISFQWRGHPLAALYRLEISGRADFTPVLHRVDTANPGCSLQLESALKEGESAVYYWRVSAGNAESGWSGRTSPVFTFTVFRKDRLPAPQLVAPLDKKKISVSQVAKDEVFFSWNGEKEATGARLLFSRSEDFKTVFREVPVASNFWSMDRAFPPGVYYWKVRQRDAAGNVSAFSAARQFTLLDIRNIALLSPHDKGKVRLYTVEKEGATFRWEPPIPKATYLFELAKDHRFDERVLSEETDAPSFVWKDLSAGVFYWRVKLLSGDKGEVLASSDTRSVILEEIVPDPEPLAPLDGAIINMTKADILEFSWKKSEGADLYEVQVFQIVEVDGKKIEQLADSYRTDALTYDIRDMNVLDMGEFCWTLTAFRKDRKGNVTPASKKIRNGFMIDLPDLPPQEDTEIRIISPEIQVLPDEPGY